MCIFYPYLPLHFWLQDHSRSQETVNFAAPEPAQIPPLLGLFCSARTSLHPQHRLGADVRCHYRSFHFILL